MILDEDCTAVVGDTMVLSDLDYPLVLDMADEPTEPEDESDNDELWLSCETPSGMIYKIQESDNSWVKTLMQDQVFLSGGAFLLTPDKSEVDMRTQSLKIPKDDLSFLEKEETNKSTKSTKARKGRKMARQLEISPVGERSVLVVRVELGDSLPTNSEEQLSASVFGNDLDPVNLSSQFKACSYGQLTFVKALDREGLVGDTIFDGVTTVSLPDVQTSSHHAFIRNRISDALNIAYNVTSPNELADHVMYCLPPGSMPAVAYGIVNSFITVYLNNWCTYVS